MTKDGSDPALPAGSWVMNYAQFPDPDAEGSYSSFSIAVKTQPPNATDATLDVTIPVDSVTLNNYYGTTSFKKDGADAATMAGLEGIADKLTNGPWVLPGDGTIKDSDWAMNFV